MDTGWKRPCKYNHLHNAGSMNIAFLKRRIQQLVVFTVFLGAFPDIANAQNSTAEVEAHNSFGSNFGNNGGSGGGGGGGGGGTDPGSGTQPQPSPTPETFQAAFEIGSSGKQVKQDCAVCHWLEVHVDGRKLEYGETVTLSKEKTHEVTVTDNPQTRGTPPQGASPPHEDNQTFTVYPKAVGNQTITEIPGSAGDPPQGFAVNKGDSLDYLIDNSQKLLAQNKDWPKNAADEPMNKKAQILPFQVQKASIRDGEFIVNIPEMSFATTGTLDLILKKQSSGEVILKTLENQSPGLVTFSLSEIMLNQQGSPLDGENQQVFDRVAARWRSGSVDITSKSKNLDVYAVEVLSQRRISNYFSPTWGGTWGGSTLQKGVYAAGQFPNGLYNVDRKSEFLNALDPQNEGLAMDGNSVIRVQIRSAQQDFPQYHYLNGSDHGYIENPDRDQDNASSPNVTLLRQTSVAVRTNADRLSYDDEVYIPGFGVRTVDDSGTLHGNTDQIDVWRGQGDQSLQNSVDAFGLQTRSCLKILTQTP